MGDMVRVTLRYSPDMTLRFFLDQSEAIRRGFDGGSIVKLQVPIPELSKEQCKFIGDRFWKGTIYRDEVTGRTDQEISKMPFLRIKEPTLHGVLEAIAAYPK